MDNQDQLVKEFKDEQQSLTALGRSMRDDKRKALARVVERNEVFLSNVVLVSFGLAGATIPTALITNLPLNIWQKWFYFGGVILLLLNAVIITIRVKLELEKEAARVLVRDLHWQADTRDQLAIVNEYLGNPGPQSFRKHLVGQIAFISKLIKSYEEVEPINGLSMLMDYAVILLVYPIFMMAVGVLGSTWQVTFLIGAVELIFAAIFLAMLWLSNHRARETDRIFNEADEIATQNHLNSLKERKTEYEDALVRHDKQYPSSQP